MNKDEIRNRLGTILTAHGPYKSVAVTSLLDDLEAFARALVVRELERVKAECLVRHGGCVEAGKLAAQSEDIKKWEASTNALYWMSEWIGDEIQRITEGA